MLNTYNTGSGGDGTKRGSTGRGGSTSTAAPAAESGHHHRVTRRGAVTDDRRVERERQIAIMDTLISDFEQSTSGIGDELHLQIAVESLRDPDGAVGAAPAGGGGGAPGGGRPSAGSSISGGSGGAADGTWTAARQVSGPVTGSSNPGGANNAPSGAIENARRFLWDDGDDAGFPDVPSGGMAVGLSDPSGGGRIGHSMPTHPRGGAGHRASTRNSGGSMGSMGSIGSMGSLDSRGSRYRTGVGGGDHAPAYSGDSKNIYRQALKSSQMPGRGSDPDLLYDHHIGKMSRDTSTRNRSFGDALSGRGRRKSIDITSVFSNIQASIGKAFDRSGNKYDSNNWDSINFEANIAPRRPSDGDDDFADMIDRQIGSEYVTGPSWMDRASERAADGLGRAGYVMGDCCDATTRSARNNKRVLLLVAAAAMVAVIATMSVNVYKENHNGSHIPASPSSSGGTNTIRSPPVKDVSSDTTHTVTTTPQVVNVPSSNQDDSNNNDGPRTSFGTIVDTTDETSRFGIIRRRILESGLSHASDLDNVSANSTPQHKALKWISDMDGAALDPQHHGMLQRYSLAVIFFSTFLSSELPDLEALKNMGHLQPVTELGEGWKDRTNWLTDKGHCSWNGVQCHPRDGTSPSLTVYNGNEGVSILNLTMNNLEGTIPREIHGLGDLHTLDLGGNLLEGTLPSELGHMEELHVLYLDGNGFDGSIPKSLGRLTQATHIYLNNNYLVGSIPEEFSDMHKLTVLSLYRNSLTGSIPHFEGLVNLRDLYLDSNYLSGEIPHSIADLRKLRDLRLGGNELTGTIPLKMCEMESLQMLYLESNYLGGTIMDCIDIMGSLVELQLFDNNFIGSIPESIGDLASLELLYIDGNGITGTLPSSIGDLTNLKTFYAQANNLTGQIPEELSKLSQLQRLYLHENQLEGSVPAELSKLSQLQRLYLHENQLEGSVPDNVCMLKDHSLVDLQSDCGSSGKIQCECCTECH